jgi:3'(2'), 5'-bisphosphate nucleotidase
MDLSHELETAKTIARMAAGICQNIREELVDPLKKNGREPVTIADYASQALIGHALAENYPDDAVLSEERSEEFMLLLNDEQRALVQRFVTDAIGGYVFEEQVCAWLDFGKNQTAARTWIIDPIDGTKGFLSGLHYCVAIGLMIDGEPVLGVLASPGFYSDEAAPPDDIGALTYASAGSGAYTESLWGGPRQPIQVSRVTEPREATLLTSRDKGHSDFLFFAEVEKNLGRDANSPARNLDSQDKHAMIAAGIGDVYLRLVPEPDFREKLWDHAAGYVIVSEAGGRISDIHGKPIDWTAGARMQNNRGVLVTNRFLHETVLKAIKKTGIE